jgi:hypothetical protein
MEHVVGVLLKIPLTADADIRHDGGTARHFIRIVGGTSRAGATWVDVVIGVRRRQLVTDLVGDVVDEEGIAVVVLRAE